METLDKAIKILVITLANFILKIEFPVEMTRTGVLALLNLR